VHATEDAATFLRELFAAPGAEITELEVHRASLEDTYMAMVHPATVPATIQKVLA
jgi:ABC-2 type transport system ATP-binding protein